MFVASFKDAWNKNHPLKLQELQLRPGVQADQASGGGVVAEAGARREMMVLRSRTTLSQLLLIQLTNTIWDKYTLRWWYCEAKRQNNSVSTAFDQSFAVCNHCNHCTPSISNSSNSTYLYDDEKMRLPENKMLSKTQSCTLFRPSFFNQTRSWPNWLPHRLILLKFHILVFCQSLSIHFEPPFPVKLQYDSWERLFSGWTETASSSIWDVADVANVADAACE